MDKDRDEFETYVADILDSAFPISHKKLIDWEEAEEALLEGKHVIMDVQDGSARYFIASIASNYAARLFFDTLPIEQDKLSYVLLWAETGHPITWK